jgi:hypothetical protein
MSPPKRPFWPLDLPSTKFWKGGSKAVYITLKTCLKNHGGPIIDVSILRCPIKNELSLIRLSFYYVIVFTRIVAYVGYTHSTFLQFRNPLDWVLRLVGLFLQSVN